MGDVNERLVVDVRFRARAPTPVKCHNANFIDAAGVEWAVYDVVSLPGFGRPGEPLLAPSSDQFARVQTWLTFESTWEKRRLTPIPEAWEEASPEALRRLLALASKVK